MRRALLAIALCVLLPHPVGAGDMDDLEHIRTGFPLTGAHERAPCEACHVGGLFEGTPRQCGICHLPGSRWQGEVKPGAHVPSSNTCDDCHLTATWGSARFDHAGVVDRCAHCHNGSIASV